MAKKKGCVWNCTVQNAEEARLLEANYSISSKQYVENGIHMKVLSKGKPNENCVLDNGSKYPQEKITVG